MTQLTRGVLISVEGIDGSGKSTLINNLTTLFTTHAFPLLVTKEPGSSALGKVIRTLVQKKEIPIGAQAEFLLFAADRAQHFEEYIIPELANKKIIISDRMADSSLVYQGYGRGLDLSLLRTVNAWVMQNHTPDITLYVKVDRVTAQQRLAARKGIPTSFEKEKESFIQKLIEGFDAVFAGQDHVIILDGTLESTPLAQKAFDEILTKLKQHDIITTN